MADREAQRPARTQAIDLLVETLAQSAALDGMPRRDLRRLVTGAVDELFALPTFQPLLTPEIFKALGHPARRRIMQLVHERGEISPAIAAAEDEWTLGTVSYHFRILKEVGLLRISRTRQRRGATEHFYVRATPQ